MQKILTIPILIIASLFLSFDKEQHDNLIYEGDRYANIELGKSKSADVIKTFGGKFKSIRYGSYSIEMKYDGFSFTYRTNDSSKTINWISFEPGSNLTTTKGLKLHRQLTVSDVIKVYGEPNWFYTTDSTELSIAYTGIEFDVKPVKRLTHKYYDEYCASKNYCDSIHTAFYKNKKIVDITIAKE